MQREPEKRRAAAGHSSDVAGPDRERSRSALSLERHPGDVTDTCCRIAEYLLDLARDGEIEEALGSLIDALDRGMRELEVDARVRAQHIHDRLHERRIAARDHRVVGQGCDPYFWG